MECAGLSSRGGGESEKLIDCIIRSRGEGREEELLGGMVFVGRWNVRGGVTGFRIMYGEYVGI
jgi:hypothetical protein